MQRGALTNLVKLSYEKVKEFLDSFDTVLTDCDGVLWLEEKAIEGSPQVLNKLRELGKRIFFVTNNSTKLREDIKDRAAKLNFICSKVYLIFNKDRGFNNYTFHFRMKLYRLRS